MIQKKFRNKLGIIISSVLLVSAIFLLSREDSSYHKLNRLEYFIKNLLYSMDDGLALVLPREEASFSLSVPYYKQENGLTCEVSALRTALAYHGTYVSEEELISKLAFDARDPMSGDGIWGDPEKGFVGEINGSVFDRTGFGVYEKPIFDLALNYRRAAIIENADLHQVLKEVLSGNPVIVWGLLSRREPIFWKTNEGKTVEAWPGEHTRVLIGFIGKPDNPKKVILIDPIYGLINMDTAKFNSDWEIMDNRAVVVYK